MQEWVWEAKGRAGEVRKGVMEAATEAAVQERLKQQNLTPTKVKKKPKEINITFGSPVTEAELVVFIRQFATMIDAGLPLVQCLEILSQQGENKPSRTHPQATSRATSSRARRSRTRSPSTPRSSTTSS
jgi:type IV pilus assembly protein PilC